MAAEIIAFIALAISFYATGIVFYLDGNRAVGLTCMILGSPLCLIAAVAVALSSSV